MNRVIRAAALAVLLLTTSCGAAAAPEPAPAAGPGFPVTVPHAYGVAEVPAEPSRVVALSVADADAALAVGVTPVAVVTPFYAPDGDLPWLAGRLGPQVTLIPGAPDFTIDTEAVAAARPDLVLGTGAALTPQAHESLTRIGVPVLAHLTDPVADRWEDRTVAVGTALGRPDAADAAVAETTGAITALRDRYPGLDGRTFSFSVIQSPSALGTLVSGDDFLTVVLGELGLRLPDTLAGRPESAPGSGIVALGPEQLTELAADLVIVVAPDPAAAEPLLTDPRAATLAPDGQVHTMDMITATALRSPSVLGLRWGLEQLDAPLAAAAG
ncbi:MULTISPECIES: ABC transporter substrate-binding protein [Pseudonocardia]|uniref:Iron ABC transporter substrate-binding protein n=2 Tax=Pseudonocardia TaxID=1847 RepID=A0ABQ0RQN5_9PSEU|nr:MULTISPECIES: ABC transporter substrate-binding protein [Pseudonocardia]OSY41807.1 putative siderophore-binding lipoprotein YfiY precursor [Pseudonocardia autotrophica]TDN71141.1 iron complex transport system substrate-binding protein [Pseudonocardia autotrophica]BBG01810.1 iron ABC transporter substrate-binding protein [Pseudonocardia autotrophica]GEC22976.1 iron ABC transporter substrate-binding protein [Pseudonocardia saturnea]